MTDEALDDEVADDAPNPKEPKNSKPWLDMICEAERVYSDYQDKADKIDKLYADLDRLGSVTRDRQFQLFWANVSVLGPSIYARPPVPVVVPRFKDRKPLPRAASEMLERCAVVSFEMENIDAIMRLVRDDLTVIARGAAWVRYETKKESGTNSERACIEHVDRRDFLHSVCRNWKEVDWVAKRSWLTKKEARKRFKKASGDAYQKLEYAVRKDADDGIDDNKLKAGIWELWCRSQNKVVWVGEGSEKCLDEVEPHLKLEGFFPCPAPAYSTVQRGTLIPVPDMVFYKDQLEEINELTARIHALSEAIKVRAFYPSGAGDISAAIESAIKSTDDNAIMIGVPNWAMMGNGGVKDMLVWLPVEMIAKTVAELVELRRQLIDDVYQITGLSDIMRGSTVASETLGAQELKSQYGSIRIRDRQDELTRFARDLTRITAEIMAENFQSKTLMDMSQMDLPTDAEIAKQVKPLEQQAQQMQAQLQQAMNDPETRAMAEQNPEKAQEIIGQAQQQLQQLGEQIGQLKETVTVDAVMKLLREQRLRPFVLDIETDSTIAPDENAQKQRATEFITAVGGLLNQAAGATQAFGPGIAPLLAESLKYTASQFRAGRQLDGAIDEFADQMKQMAGQPQANPEAEAAAAAAKAQEAEAQIKAISTKADAAAKEADAQAKLIKANSDAADADLARRAKEQQEMDSSEARKTEMADKSNFAQQQMAQSALEHGQKMELGRLAIAKETAQIRSIGMKADTDAMAAMGEQDEAAEGEEAPAPTPLKLLVEAFTQQGKDIREGLAGVGAGLQMLAQSQAAPKRIVRGPDGRAVGVEPAI